MNTRTHFGIVVVVVSNAEQGMDVIPDGATIYRCVDVLITTHAEKTALKSVSITLSCSIPTPYSDKPQFTVASLRSAASWSD